MKQSGPDGRASNVMEEVGFRRVIDAIFTFVGLFSREGVVLDVNQAPLTASTLGRDQVVGHRFVDLPWFAHSAGERARIAGAISAAARGELVRLETRIRSAKGGAPLCIDASFAPLRDQNGAITHVVGSGVDVTGRKQAEEALAASETRLAEAQRVAHIGSWEWNIIENRIKWSEELFHIYGVDGTGYVPTYDGFLARVHPDDLENTEAVIRRAVRDVAPFVYDHRIRRPDGEVRMLHTRGRVMADGEGRAARLVGSCWDVTERWESTRELERSIATLLSTLEATVDGIVVGDRFGRVSALNQRFLAMWRLPSDVGPGADIRDLAERVRDQLAEPDAFVTKVVELYGDSAREGFDVLRFKDGRVFERYSVPQRAGGEICGRVCSFRDVTQREQLLARLDAIREEERRLIAREIHDQIGQSLTALKLDVAWLRSKAVTPGADVDARAAAMESLIDHTIDTAQRVSTALRPAILDDLGLAAALRWQVREFEQRTGLPCALDLSSDDTTIEPATALGLFRIAQEALTNVARHAGARQVRVDLAVGAELAALTVSDDGRGVTPEELARPTSLGLLGMRERALVVGGQVTIVGTPGKGTTLTARVPVRGAAARS